MSAICIRPRTYEIKPAFGISIATRSHSFVERPSSEWKSCVSGKSGPTRSCILRCLQSRLYKSASGFNGRPHRLVPRRGELDCRMLLFTSELDPTTIANAAQHQFTRGNRKASGDL